MSSVLLAAASKLAASSYYSVFLCRADGIFLMSAKSQHNLPDIWLAIALLLPLLLLSPPALYSAAASSVAAVCVLLLCTQ